MVDVVNVIAISWDGTSIMNLHANVVQEVVIYDVNTSTILDLSNVCREHSVPNIDTVSTEICHVLLELVVLNYYMRLFTILPVRWVYCYGSSKGSTNVIRESTIFDNNSSLVSWYVNESKPFI